MPQDTRMAISPQRVIRYTSSLVLGYGFSQTLKYRRRLRENMIELYKITHNMHEHDVWWTTYDTIHSSHIIRGIWLLHYDVRKCSCYAQDMQFLPGCTCHLYCLFLLLSHAFMAI